ncbi:hypothetical protein LTR37_007960 [Vermiconidia calcicola]|uniref:Uncharacterized protein n=1 Tax=Vermiconidia calcicola TaxID=1690605 RepID=A0ACC3NBX7_9PEZI|nr:hypothetical protein LTR37_007960 [Vermiconidia calcicola]
MAHSRMVRWKTRKQTNNNVGYGKDSIRAVDYSRIIQNPRKWSGTWKLLVTFEICIVNFAVYSASSIYVPGIPGVVADFGVSETIALTRLLAGKGYGFGPMLWSPTSEMPKLGRGGIYSGTLLAFVLLQLPTGFAVHMPMFLIFRFLTRFCGSPCLSAGGATIMDMYDSAHAAYAICIWRSFGMLGPVLGSIVSGYVAMSSKG